MMNLTVASFSLTSLASPTSVSLLSSLQCMNVTFPTSTLLPPGTRVCINRNDFIFFPVLEGSGGATLGLAKTSSGDIQVSQSTPSFFPNWTGWLTLMNSSQANRSGFTLGSVDGCVWGTHHPPIMRVKASNCHRFDIVLFPSMPLVRVLVRVVSYPGLAAPQLFVLHRTTEDEHRGHRKETRPDCAGQSSPGEKAFGDLPFGERI